MASAASDASAAIAAPAASGASPEQLPSQNLPKKGMAIITTMPLSLPSEESFHAIMSGIRSDLLNISCRIGLIFKKSFQRSEQRCWSY